MEFSFFDEELRRRINGLQIEGELVRENNRVMATYSGDALDDVLAGRLADTLKKFIETITPIVNEFEDEQSSVEANP